MKFVALMAPPPKERLHSGPLFSAHLFQHFGPKKPILKKARVESPFGSCANHYGALEVHFRKSPCMFSAIHWTLRDYQITL